MMGSDGASPTALGAGLDAAQPAGASSIAGPSATASLPETIASFQIVRRLGAGGMGVVYLARDTRLDREVAIKVPSVRSGEAGFDRLQREAAAMAKLSHPNVLQVYEVGAIGDQLFIVMEYCRGGTLGRWLESRPSTRDVLDAFVDAGRGLAAAHAAGLIHRDFKPENVFRAEDGRVMVADFGLARAVGSPPTTESPPSTLTSSGNLNSKLTMTGAALGTPAYMAPEQFVGEADERADQFAFCVSLYEAVSGVHPFGGDSAMQLRDRAVAGRFQAPRPGRRVPGWLRSILHRGLAAEHDDRYPSMQALLDAIRRGRRRLPVALASAGIVAGLISVGVATWAATSSDETEPCRDVESRLDAVWNPGVRKAMTAAFTATGEGAAEIAARAASAIDGYANRWKTMRIDACEATRVRNEQSESLMDLRVACLERRRSELDALVQLMRDKPSVEIVATSIEAVQRLTPIDHCADTEALLAAYPAPNAAQAGPVAALRQRVDRLDARSKVGQYLQSLPEAAELKAALASVDYPPVHAEALLVIGRLEKKTENAQAEATLTDATYAAARARDDRRMAQAQVELVRVVGHLGGRNDQALVLAKWAEASILRAGNDPVMLSELQMHRGSVFQAKGDYKQALQVFEQALATKLKAVPANDPTFGTLYQNMSIALRSLRDYDRSRDMAAKAKDVVSAGWGEGHPEVGDALNLLAIISDITGDSEKALGMFRQAEVLLRRAYGTSHLRVATATNNVGIALRRMGRIDEAHAQFRRAYEIGTAAVGADHPRMDFVLINIGDAAVQRESWDEAVEVFDKSIAVLERAHGANTPKLIRPLIGRGEAALGLKDNQRAMQLCKRAEQLMDKGHPDSARVQDCLKRAR